MATPLILTRASVSRSSGQWRDDDYDVLENGVVVGRIFFLDAVGPQARPWMWASGHRADSVKRAAYGYEGDARGCDGSVREELAAIGLRPRHRRFSSAEQPNELHPFIWR
jgi:hypothetical protein